MKGLLEENLRRILESWGYQEIRPPILGDLNLWDNNNIVKIIDGEGKILALRPEITSLVIENITYENLPLRLYYMGPIFYLEKGKIKEDFQVGWELINPEEEWRDIEGLALVFNVLKDLKLGDFLIELNDTRIWEIVRKEFDDKKTENLKKYIIKRDYVGFFEEIYKENFDKEKLKDLENLIFYPQDKIKNREIRERIEKLEIFREKLEALGIDSEKIIISPSLLRPFEYYNGLIFQVYIKDLKTSLGGGGSYAQYNRKGEKILGIGFAFREGVLNGFFSSSLLKRKIYVGDPKKYLEYFRLLEEERKKGNKVIFIPYSESLNINFSGDEVFFLK